MLNISEQFYSIQGEGATVGVPAYFIRLQGCNLMCGGPSASLVKEGKATWWCDTEAIWKKGIPTTNEELEQAIKDACNFSWVLNGQIHLVWTGGEPTLPRARKSIIEFVDYLSNKYVKCNIYNELETNGTVVVEEPRFYGNFEKRSEPLSPEEAEELLDKWSKVLTITNGKDQYSLPDKLVLLESPEHSRCRVIDQINCSPKLSNSGMSESMRINPKAIRQIKQHVNYWFKFVIKSEDDMKEIEENFVNQFGLDSKRVLLMPACDNAGDLPEATRFLFEMSKKYGYRAVTRQHILAWGRTVGV